MLQSAKPLGLTALETGKKLYTLSCLLPLFKEHKVLGLYREYSLSSPHLPWELNSANLVLY